MKKRFNIKPYQLFALVVIAFASFSCSEKFFDEQNGERITPDQHYKSINDIGATLDGVLVPLQGVAPNTIMIDGLRSDQMIATPNADAFLKDINNQVFSFDNPYLDASDYYKVIINVNEALLNVDKVTQYDRQFNEFYLKYTKRALISLRSWTYLQLVRLYGEAALINDNLPSLPENLHQEILTKSVMIDTLINQLVPTIPTNAELTQYAEPYFGGFPNSRAVLGELYLEKGDYANAITYLKMAAESYGNGNSVYKVDNGYTMEAWKSIFQDAEYQQTENITVIPYNQQQKQFNPLAKWLLPNDQFMAKPTQLLVDSFLTQIPAAGTNGDVFRGIGATLDTTSSGEFYVNKYSINKSEPFSTDIILSRAADIHLLLAEALNRNGDSKTALILLNAGFKGEKTVPATYNRWNKNIGIRGRAYLKPKLVPDSLTVINNGDTSKVALQGEERIQYIEDLIMDERALELAFEGKRWFDLVRVAERRSNPAYLADKVAAKFTDPSEKEAIRLKLMNKGNWYLPYKKEVKEVQ